MLASIQPASWIRTGLIWESQIDSAKLNHALAFPVVGPSRVIADKVAIGSIGQAVQLSGRRKDEPCDLLSDAIEVPSAFDLAGSKVAVGVFLEGVCLIAKNVVA